MSIVDISTETVKRELGLLSGLSTTDRTTLIAAINEVDSHADTANTAIGTLADYQGSATTSVTAALNEQFILRNHDKFDGTAFDSADTYSLCAVHGVEVYGSDPTLPHKIYRVYRNSPTQGYRVIIMRRNAGTWERVIDTNGMPGVVTENAEGITAVVVPAACNVLGTVATAWAKLWIDYSRVTAVGYDYCSLGVEADDPPYVIKPKNVFSSTGALNTIANADYAGAINEVLEDVDNIPDMYKAAKWGAVYSGTIYQRGALSLRFDDGTDDDYSVTYPLLLARNLVGGFAVSAGKLDTAGYLTTAQTLEMQSRGMEIMCHSRSHAADPTSYAAFVDETATAASELRTAGCCINQFIQPGTWTGAYRFTTEDQLLSREGRLLRLHFGAMGAYVSSTDYGYDLANHYALPRRSRFGSASYSGYAASLATLEDYVDKVSKYGCGLSVLFHSANFDTEGNISTADFTTWLDYVEAARDAGLIDVLTPTAQFYATQAPMKTNLIADGDFALSATGAWVFWEIGAGAPAVVGGGISGNCAQVNSTNYIRQYLSTRTTRSLTVDCWAKSATGSAATARVYVHDGSASALAVTEDVAVTDWTHIRFNVGVTASMSNLYVRLTNNGAGPDVLFDDVQVYKT